MKICHDLQNILKIAVNIDIICTELFDEFGLLSGIIDFSTLPLHVL